VKVSGVGVIQEFCTVVTKVWMLDAWTSKELYCLGSMHHCTCALHLIGHTFISSSPQAQDFFMFVFCCIVSDLHDGKCCLDERRHPRSL
jgi:hypothetical protein